jgi:hypothetical protein
MPFTRPLEGKHTMQIPYETATLDGIDPAYREHYVQTDNGYRLDVSGIESKDQLLEDIRTERAAKKIALDKFSRLERAARELAHEPPPIVEPTPVPRHPDDLRLEAETAAKIAAREADWKAQVDSLRSDRDTTALERVAVELATKLAVPGSHEVLLPHIRTRLVANDAGGIFTVTARDAASLEHLTEQFRSDPKFARLIAGHAPADQALHRKRVEETLGVVAAPASITRAAFEALTPAARSAFARNGGKIIDG